MKISEKQLLTLFNILTVVNNLDLNINESTKNSITNLLNDIHKQQSDELIDTK